MRGIPFGLGQLSASEKTDILSQHKSVYNGYQTMQPQVSNTQPLTVYDFAGDKEGLVVNNKGEVKKYTNVGINEQINEKEMCSECGGMMQEGECSECGWKGDMEEQFDDEIEWEEDDDFDEMPIKDDSIFDKEKNKEFRPGVDLGKSFSKFKDMLKLDDLDEATGHLDDIYDEEDLSPKGEFDYVSGGGNDYGTFEKAHHMKEQIKSPIGKISSIGSMEEQGGNADDMDVDNVEPAYNFDSNGPNAGGDVYPTNEVDEKYDIGHEFEVGNDRHRPKGHEKLKKGDKVKIVKKWKNIPGDVFGTDKSEDDYGLDYDDIEKLSKVEEMKFEPMESAWADDVDEQDISGTQGIYSRMKEPYDFDSEGPGKAGPYQTRNESGYEGEDEDAYWEKDLDDDELDLDLTKFNPEDKSWEEISQYTGDDEFGHVDEDIRESFINQKNRIMEMMNRMNVIK